MRLFSGKVEKPSGLPFNWPNSSDEEIKEMKNRVVKVGLEQQYWFSNNVVKTSKYNFWNFLPFFLMEEFNPRTKIANVYFLLICGLQLIPTISNTGGIPTTMVPLFFIVTIDGLFAAIEDYARHKADTIANSTKTLVLDKSVEPPRFKEILWADVQVGDFIKIRSRETVPCDILLLDVAPTLGISNGVCFIETKSLDGETNLKTREAISINKNKIMQHHNSGLWYSHLKGQIDMEHPNSLIDSFSGVFETFFPREVQNGTPVSARRASTKTVTMEIITEVVSDDEDTNEVDSNGGESKFNNKLPIQPNNVLLRGCILRNNEWLVGLVVNTGHDTKVMMTSAPSALKLSFVEIKASIAIKYIILFLLSLGLIASTGQIIWNETMIIEEFWYLNWELKDGKKIFLQWLISNFYYLLLHSSIIPVSLYVSMTFSRFIQSYFMIQDLEMFNDNNVITQNIKGKIVETLNPNEQPCIVRSMTLNEELGHVSHIFSDKTGTLTSNIMEFRKMSINGISYGMGITDIGRAAWKLQKKPVPAEVLIGEQRAKINKIPNVVFYCDRYNDDVGYSSKFKNGSISSFNSNSCSINKKVIDGNNNDMELQNFEDDNNQKSKPGFSSSNTYRDIANNKIDSNIDESAKIVQAKKIDFFFKMISLCHDAIREVDSSSSSTMDQSGNIKLSASNPDDQALISAAEYFGYAFNKREENGIVVVREKIDKTITFKDVDYHDTKDITYDKNWLNDESRYYEHRYKIVQTITFSSKRKRMSVIVQNLDDPDGDFTLFCKGAETVIYERLGKNNNDAELIKQTDKHIQLFSIEGLRCLLLCYKTIPKADFLDWETNYKKSKSNLAQIESKKKGLPNEIEMLENEVENGMILLGATGIEDRLQNGVPECIESLLNAGLNVWVLTGDKEETAINIAVACNLFATDEEYMRRIVINRSTCRNLTEAIDLMNYEIKLYNDENENTGNPKPRSLVVDGPSLLSIFAENKIGSHIRRSGSSMIVTKKIKQKFTFLQKDSFSSVSPLSTKIAQNGNGIATKNDDIKLEPRDIFVKMAMICKSVVCCRVSPDQKREVVNLVRSAYPNISTLAIGDGANDVAMIKEAHIGVGIKGEEGVQAVNAADYAFTQFRFLRPLLLKHGRYNYIRLTRLICYVFYKNILMTMGLFWFNLYCGFSGQKIYTEAATQLYNLFFTSLPIVLYASYDKDIDTESVYKNPWVYATGRHNLSFDSKNLLFFIINAIVDSALVVHTSFKIMNTSSGLSIPNAQYPGDPVAGGDDLRGSRGYLNSFWDVGAVIYTSIVIIANLKMFYFQSDWSYLHYAALAIGFLAWISIAFGVSSYISLDFDWYCLFFKLVNDGVFWSVCLLSIVIVSLKDIILLSIKKIYFRTLEDEIQELQYVQKKAKVNPTDSGNETPAETPFNGGASR